MSTVSYNLRNKGIRLISAEEAWKIGKNGKFKLNNSYHIIGKIDIKMPNMIVTASDKNKPKFKGNTCDLNSKAKSQIVDHFFDKDGKRNKKSVAYIGIKKQTR